MTRRNRDRLGRWCKGSATRRSEYEADFFVRKYLGRGDTLARETTELENATKIIRQWCEVVITGVQGTSDAKR